MEREGENTYWFLVSNLVSNLVFKQANAYDIYGP